MILVLVVAFAGLFFIKGPDGEPIMSLDDLKPTVPEVELSPVSAEPTRVYKWKDENGVWQFSNEPVDNQNVEVMELDGKINTMPSIDVASQNTSNKTEKKNLNIPGGLTTVAPEKISEMMDNVNNLQDTMDQRAEDVNKTTSGRN